MIVSDILVVEENVIISLCYSMLAVENMPHNAMQRDKGRLKT